MLLKNGILTIEKIIFRESCRIKLVLNFYPLSYSISLGCLDIHEIETTIPNWKGKTRMGSFRVGTTSQAGVN